MSGDPMTGLPDFSLEGRIAAVTGAASGIGRGIARTYAAAGASLAILDRDLAAAEIVAGEIRGAGGRATAFLCDVAEEASVIAAFAALRNELGDPDILVNNAGVLRDTPFETMTTAEWDRVIGVNLRGTFLCSREVVPAMRRQKWGRIINIASQLAQKGAAELTHYTASKAGIIGFTKSLALELARDGITVNALCPGIIDTPMSAGVPDAVKRSVAEKLPIGRFGRVDEVTGAALLLASEAGSYFVGASVNVNGGDVMM